MLNEHVIDLQARTHIGTRVVVLPMSPKSLVELRAASMPDAAWAVSGIPQADPGGMTTPQFWHRLHAFRHVISGSLALASLNLTRWDCSQR